GDHGHHGANDPGRPWRRPSPGRAARGHRPGGRGGPRRHRAEHRISWRRLHSRLRGRRPAPRCSVAGPGREAIGDHRASHLAQGARPRLRRRERAASRRHSRRRYGWLISVTDLSPMRRPRMVVRVVRTLVAVVLFAGMTGGARPADAQAPVELSFYYPVAVGGVLTKIVDHLAADLEKEKPGSKVKPISAGTYQETIVKALTALKSGEPPQMSVLLSTDMFTLIDEGAIVPFDDLATSAEDKTWLKSFFPAFMLNSQTGAKPWALPFHPSTLTLSC